MSAILLLGGRSTRMGSAKADLVWRGLPLAVHMAGILQQATTCPIVAVAAPDQTVPALPSGVELVRDRTHTCYLGVRDVRHDWGYGCGSCPACELRAKGFAGYRAR